VNIVVQKPDAPEPLDFLEFRADLSTPNMVGTYDELPLWSAMFGLLLLEHVPLKDVLFALDVGCGTGFPLIELAERLGPTGHVHGIDPWSAALGRAREKIAARGTTNVTVHEGIATKMPFDDETFDLIVSNLGVNNFDDRVGSMRECRRVTKAGATVALTTNLQGHMQEFYEVFDRVLQEDGNVEARRLLREHLDHRATVTDVRQLLEEARFSVRRVVEKTSCMRFARATALFNHHFIKLGFLDAWKKVVPGRETEVFTHIRRALDETATRAGELRLTIPMAYVEGVAV
jgi:ubiquinone/menaquinone biosynthesis C-methylase UbiE